MKPIKKLIIVLLILAYAFGGAMLLTGCSAVHEGITSPCWSSKHIVGYGPGGFGKGRMKN